jgi:hypothetical protein
MAVAQNPIAAENFVQLSAAKGLSISPDGTKIAYLSQNKNDKSLVIEDLLTREQSSVDLSHLRLFSTRWVRAFSLYSGSYPQAVN